MEIFNFVSTLLVSVSFFSGCVLSLETYYPPKIISDANFCFFDWTIEAAYCNSRTRPAYERTLFRLKGKKVILFSEVILLLTLMLLSTLKISQTYSTSWNYRDDGTKTWRAKKWLLAALPGFRLAILCLGAVIDS